MKKVIMGIICLLMLVGCGGSSASSDVSGTVDDGGTGGGDESGDTSSIAFDLSDAVAVLISDEKAAQTSKALTMGGNVYKLTASGTIAELFTSGEAISALTLYVAPDGKLYILFQSPVTIDSESCILLRIARDGTWGCVDHTLAGISTFSVPTEPIQFDGSGNIYYAGYTSDGKRVLRKQTPSLSGTTDLINDSISIERFLVGDDGTVYLSGNTEATQTSFFRKIHADGTLENLMNGSDIQSLYELPDGNVYAGDWGQKFGVMKVTTGGVDDTLYIGYTSMNGIPYTATFYCDDNVYDTCTSENRPAYEDFCGMGGTVLTNYYQSPDDHVYVVVGRGDRASLWQYWPDVMPVDTGVYRPTIVKGTLNTLLIAGYDEVGVNKLIAYDTTDQSETDLLNGEDIEVYHFSYSDGRVIFDGLRFSDNEYIVGSIDTNNGNELTILESGIRYEDIQFFE